MYLSLEETLARIKEYEKDDPTGYIYCREKKLPYQVHIYKGENQIIVVPVITTIGWYSTEMAWCHQIIDVQNGKLIGETVMDAIEHIRVSPVDARTRKEREADDFRPKITKYKSHKSFDKNYLWCAVMYYEDGSYVLCPGGHNEIEFVYDEKSRKVVLPAESSDEIIGRAVIDCFTDMEIFYTGLNGNKKGVSHIMFETPSNHSFSFTMPLEDVYTATQDYHAAEIYQGYSCYKEGKDDSVADMYFACASELDCDTSLEHIQRVYESYDGSASSFVCEEVEHPVFEQRIEMKTTSVHRIVYVKRISECELLSCELVLKVKLAGQRLHDKIVKDFETMVSSCRPER